MTEKWRPITICGIVPAAGSSRRMGRAKQSLPFGASTVTGTVVRTMLSAGVDSLVVVTRTDLANELDLPDDRRLVVIVNDDPSTEMIDSIRLALKHTNHNRRTSTRAVTDDGVLVVPGDMPAVPLTAYRRCLVAYQDDPSRIIVASHRGRRGHPMIFPSSLATALLEIQSGLNELPRRFPGLVQTVDVSDPGVLRDINDPSEYGMLTNEHEGRSTSSRD